MEHAYRCAGCEDFSATVGALDRALAAEGLHIRAVRDVHVTLAAKGFPIRPVRVYEVAGTPEPSRDSAPACTLLVDEEAGTVWVTLLRPEMAAEFWSRLEPNDDRDRIAEDAANVERRLIEAIGDAVDTDED